MDKSKLLDVGGRPLTQSLFLEINYNEYAVYTLKDDDHELNGKVYPSLKKLYLAMEDPLEYEFATKYLLGWQHWKRLCENKIIRKHIDEWREELEIKIRSQGVREMMSLVAQEGGNFSAAKYLANKEWDKRTAGRPSKSEVERQAAIENHISEEFSADVARLADFRKDKNG